MNYYEYLNKTFETVQGQQVAQNNIKYENNTNPFSESIMNANKTDADKTISTVQVNGVSIFENATKSEVENIDYEKLTAKVEDSENPQKFSPLEFILKNFLNIDKIKELADKDGNGEISKDEAKDYIEELAKKDGNAEKLSLEDFQAVLEENQINLEELLAKEQENTEQTDTTANTETTADDYGSTVADTSSYAPVETTAPVSYAPSPSGNYTNYASVSEKFNSIENQSLEELQAEKTTRENTLKEKQTALDAVYNGENENVKAAKTELDKAQEEYEKALAEDEGAKEFAPQILENNEKTAQNEENLNKNAKAITDKENEISTSESALTSLNGELEVLQGSLSALPSPTGKEEDKEKDAQIASKKSELEKAISGKKEEIANKEKELDNLKKELENLNKEKTELEKEKQTLAEEKEKLDKMVEEHCNDVTKAKLQAFNNAKANLETVKSKEIETAKAEVAKAQESVKEIDTKIAEKKVLEETKQYTVAQGGDLKPGLFKGTLAGKEDLVNEICHKYGVDPALVASIIGLESGWGTSNLAQHNNFMGYRKAGDAGKNGKGFGYFSTPEKGLDAAIKNLASYTRYSDVAAVDFNNIREIGGHYCEGNVWANKVMAVHDSRVKKYIA